MVRTAEFDVSLARSKRRPVGATFVYTSRPTFPSGPLPGRCCPIFCAEYGAGRVCRVHLVKRVRVVNAAGLIQERHESRSS